MALDAHQSQQEAKYHVPYHYSLNRWTPAGVTYLSYLRRARDLLLARTPKRALDAGCGDGRFVAFVREADDTFPIEGTDYSETALDFARLFNPGARFHHGDLLGTLPFHDGEFDALTLIEVVEHFPPEKLTHVLTECRRILKPGGTVIITTPTTHEKKISKAHFQHFTEETMRRYLTDAGFRDPVFEGNFRASMVQTLCQGLMENRLWAARWKPLLSAYARAFDARWAHCPLAAARRMIVTANA